MHPNNANSWQQDTVKHQEDFLMQNEMPTNPIGVPQGNSIPKNATHPNQRLALNFHVTNWNQVV